jgi:glycosyltransferase involved in cell wall biosynthesis
MPVLHIECTRSLSSGLYTGIQRYTRHLLRAGARLSSQHPGWRVQALVREAPGWRVPVQLPAHRLEACPSPVWRASGREPPPRPGDWILLVDTPWYTVPPEQLQRWRKQGIHLAVVCYDMLPAEHPDWFAELTSRCFEPFWRVAAQQADVLVAISSYTRERFWQWCEAQRLPRRPMEVVAPLMPLAEPGRAVLPAGPCVLQLGTIEPRKGHAQVLAAFEQAWAQGCERHWCIVGRPGWKCEALIERLSGHAERGRRLHWFQDLDDAAVAACLRDAGVLLAASRDEGFDLPVHEALQAGCPVWASDIPVHRGLPGVSCLPMPLEPWRLAQALPARRQPMPLTAQLPPLLAHLARLGSVCPTVA